MEGEVAARLLRLQDMRVEQSDEPFGKYFSSSEADGDDLEEQRTQDGDDLEERPTVGWFPPQESW